jgi:sporulation protein YlmC with PRC-barrel domain
MKDDILNQDNARASDVTGANIYDGAGELIGQLDDLVFGKHDGEIKFAILTLGRYIGVGHDYFPMPWRELNYNQYFNGFVINYSRQELGNAPRYTAADEPDWNDRAFIDHIDGYYR